MPKNLGKDPAKAAPAPAAANRQHHFRMHRNFRDAMQYVITINGQSHTVTRGPGREDRSVSHAS